MKKIFKKKQLVLAGLVLMLAAAVYVNWQFNSNTLDNKQSITDENLGDAEYVGNDNVKITDEEEGYFEKTRSEREEARDELLEDLEEMQKDVESTDAEISNAVQKQVEILSYIETESNVETLVKAKGFEDCVCIVSEEGINVIVKATELKNADILQIQDVVLSQKKVTLDSIKIINVE